MQSYPVELSPPDIRDHAAGNTGVDYFTTLDSGLDGPHVMVTAVTHGNELCGAIVLDRLIRDGIRPSRGRLTLGFCNVEAFLSFNPDYPTVSRFVDEDMNRVWDVAVLDGERTSTELTRSRAIRPILDTADVLLDIHSMQNPTAPLMLAGPTEKGTELALAVGYPEYVIIDAGHAAGRRMRDYDFFSDPRDPRAALLVECGQHWAAGSADVAMITTLRFLLSQGTIDQAFADRHMPDVGPMPAQKVIRITDPVTVQTTDFRFHEVYYGMEVIAKGGTEIAVDGDRPIVTPYDNCVLIMPSRRLAPGQTAVRLGRFVD